MGGDGESAQVPARPDESSWILLNDELRLRLEVQRAAFAKLEGRATILLGSATAALLFVAKEEVASNWLLLGLAAFAISIGFSLVIAVLPSEFEELKPRSLIVGLWLRSEHNAAAELANNRLGVFERNVGRQQRFVWFVRISVAFALAGAAFSTLHLTQGDRPDVDRQRSPACATHTTGANGCNP